MSTCRPTISRSRSPASGTTPSALDHLEQAFAQRDMRIVNLGDPEFDGLRTEPRYRRLLDRLRLPAAS